MEVCVGIGQRLGCSNFLFFFIFFIFFIFFFGGGSSVVVNASGMGSQAMCEC